MGEGVGRWTEKGLATALVIFTAGERELAALDVAAGPCVRAGRKRPLVSPLHQDFGDTLDHVRALHGVLTGDPPDAALGPEQVAGPSRLAALSAELAAALVTLLEAELPQVEAALRRGAVYEPPRFGEVAARWLAAAGWSPAMELGGLRSRLITWGNVARRARDKGWLAYAWQGPSVPAFGLAFGVGWDSYARHREGKK